MKEWWKLWPRHFSPEECQRIISEALRLKETLGTIGSGKSIRVDPDYRSSRVRWIQCFSPNWQWLVARLDHLFHLSNKLAFGFDLTKFYEIQFTEYDAKYEGKYDWHEDVTWISQTYSHRKLSLVVQLTDPETYEGGEFELEENSPQGKQREELKSQGSVIVFPAFLSHRVSPVTEGTRHSLVTWNEGPLFR